MQQSWQFVPDPHASDVVNLHATDVINLSHTMLNEIVHYVHVENLSTFLLSGAQVQYTL